MNSFVVQGDAGLDTGVLVTERPVTPRITLYIIIVYGKREGAVERPVSPCDL